MIEPDSFHKIMRNVLFKEAHNCTSLVHSIHKWCPTGQKVEANQLS